MLGRIIRAGIGLGSVTILLGYAAAGGPAGSRPLAPWLLAAGIALLVVSLLALGTLREHRRTPVLLWIALAIVGLTLGGGFAAALALPPEAPGSALLLGLPRRAALVLYGIGLLPALVIPLVYALTFDRTVLTGARLERLRAELSRVRSGGGIPDRRE